MSITSDIYSVMSNGTKSIVPLYTDLELDQFTNRTLREIYENTTYHVYNLDPDNWIINYTIVDTRRNINVGQGVLANAEHTSLVMDDAITEFRVDFVATIGTLSADTISTVQYIKRNKDDYDINDLYGDTTLLINGLNLKRSQNLITAGLAFNQDFFKNTEFSLRSYTPDYMYDEPAAAELINYFEAIFGTRFNIIKQLDQFDTVYDNISEFTAHKYGVPVEWINHDYTRYNIIKNRDHIKNLYSLWTKKGTLAALYGALKFFCDVHPAVAYKEEKVGWHLYSASGQEVDLDVTTFSEEESSAPTQEDYIDPIVFGADATEQYYATDQKLAIKLNYFIDVWGVKQDFSQFGSVQTILDSYEFGDELLHSLFTTTNAFTSLNAKVYYWWTKGNSRVNMLTSPVEL